MKDYLRNPNAKSVLIIHHSSSIGGAGISLLHIILSLKELNFNVKVYCPSEIPNMKDEINKLGVTNISGPISIPLFPHFNGSNNFIFGFRFIRQIIDLQLKKKLFITLIKNNPSDLIIFNTMTLFYLGKSLKSMGAKKICLHRETYAKGIIGLRSYYIKSSLANYFDLTIFISKFDLESSKIIGYKRALNYDRVDLESYLGNEKNQEDLKKILYTGGMSKLKGAHIILKAITSLESNYHLIFLQYELKTKRKSLKDIKSIKNKLKYILKLDYEARVLKLMEKNRLYDRVTFHKQDVNIQKYYVESDLVVFPSTLPHQSRPIYEAGAAKRPIIITKSKNIKEFVTDMVNGVYFKKNNSKDLAKKIELLIEDNNLLKKVVDNNYLMTIKNHNLSDQALNLKKIFDEFNF